ncbi:MAG: hypothetical protein J6Q84_07220 [Kiritimatiellae bacterium]|nr:hypothetical protein [Kiritimatiellia bacterium]
MENEIIVNETTNDVAVEAVTSNANGGFKKFVAFGLVTATIAALGLKVMNMIKAKKAKKDAIEGDIEGDVDETDSENTK